MARYARDVLSRDVPRETGCSRSARSFVLKNLVVRFVAKLPE